MKQLIQKIHHYFSYRLSLMTQLLLSYLVLIIIPLLLVTLLSNGHVSKTLIQQFRSTSDTSVHQSVLYLDTILTNINNSTESISNNKQLSEIYFKNAGSGKLLEKYNDFCNSFTIVNGSFISEPVYSTEIYVDGKFTFSESIGQKGVSFISMDTEPAQEFYRALSGFRGQLKWIGPRDMPVGYLGDTMRVITGARYMRSTITSKIIGIITVNVPQSSLNEIIRSSALLPGSLVLLTDQDGAVLAFSDGDLYAASGLTRDILSALTSSQEYTIRAADKRFLYSGGAISSTGWRIFLFTPFNEILKTSNDTRNRMLTITAIVSVCFCIASFFISKTITKRIRGLSKRMKEVEFENYSPIPSPGGTDEISNLIDSYNLMLTKINDYAGRQYSLGVEIKNTEMKALTAQINPHFLYNTLDLLHWLAKDKGAKDIAEIVSLLSQYYKLSLNKGMETISVHDAIRHIEVYIKLQNYRFNDSIRLTLNISPEIEHYPMLKLLLQPIVENAVLHGILEREERAGEITITGKKINKVLCFWINDNGIGMTRHEIEELTNPTQQTESSFGGYGIKNVITRIRLYYGENYGLSYTSTPGRGTSVLMQIPAVDDGSTDPEKGLIG